MQEQFFIFISFLEYLQGLPSLGLSLLTFFSSAVMLMAFLFFFKKSGLYVYIVLSLLVGNIQALKGIYLPGVNYPIPLGMEVFASITIACEILANRWGTKAALKAVKLGFLTQFCFTFLIFITLGFKPLELTDLNPSEYFLSENHHHLYKLFMPMPGMMLASWLAFSISQSVDILIFQRLKDKMLWLRGNIAGSFSCLIDHIIFNFLAWVVFMPEPLNFDTFWTGFVLVSFAIRIFYNFLYTPLLYWANTLSLKPN
ncbi:MAG: hypothetical protein JWM09_1241 [Francisellaceae bacterium]|nr:hypothetical protein [Francisellaceae bacterium]